MSVLCNYVELGYASKTFNGSPKMLEPQRQPVAEV